MNNAHQREDRSKSYAPQDRPEIIVMAQKARFQSGRAAKVKTDGDGTYIDGIPPLKWGQWRDCVYSGAIEVLLGALGIPASYEHIAGLSGSAYRFAMRPDWDPSASLLQVGANAEMNCNLFYGIDAYSVDDESRDQKVMRSIEKGVPVLICGGRFAPEWSLLTGYQHADGKVKFYGRSYFDFQGARDDEIFTQNQYYFADHYPGEYPSALLRLYDRSCPALSLAEALRRSLKACIDAFHQPKSGELLYGYDAYECAASGFEEGNYGHVSHHFSALLDARRCAYRYLEDSALLLSGDLQNRLLAVAALYREIFCLLAAAMPYEELNEGKFESDLSPDFCQKVADTLRCVSGLEKQIRVLVSEILIHWDAC